MVKKSSNIDSTKLARMAGLVGMLVLQGSLSLHAQWRQINVHKPHFSGEFNSIYFLDLPGPPRIGFVSFADSIFKTTDGGYTWHAVDYGIYPYMALDFAFKDSTTGWYSGTYGVHKTTDGGNTWKIVNDSLGDVFYDEKHDGLLAFGGGWGPQFIATSWDEGANWMFFQPDDPYQGAGNFSFWNGDTGVIPWWTGGTSFFITMDGGKSWNMARANVGNSLNQVLAIPGTSTAFAMDNYGVIRRTDDLWNSANTIYEFPPSETRGIFPIANAAVSTDIFGDSENMYVMLDSGCFRSTDQGKTWKYLCGVGPTAFPWPQKYYAKGDKVFIGTYDTTYYGRMWMLNVDSMQYFPTGIAYVGGGKDTTIVAGTPVTIQYFPETSDLIGIDTGVLVFRYDSDVLDIKNIQLQQGWQLVSENSHDGILTLQILADSSTAISNPMVSLTFNTYLPPKSATTTHIYLDSTYLSGKRLNCDCQALSTGAPDSVTINFIGCGDSLLEAEMNHEPPFTIESVVPNPASTSLRVEGRGQRVEATLFDALGKEVIPSSSYTFPFTLHVSALPSGIYLLRFYSNGYSISRSISISR